jgi:hypothetical protein
MCLFMVRSKPVTNIRFNVQWYMLSLILQFLHRIQLILHLGKLYGKDDTEYNIKKNVLITKFNIEDV